VNDSLSAVIGGVFTLIRRGAVAQVTMHSPPVNSISEPWLAAFHAVLDEIESVPTISVLHLRSSLKVFAAGGDLRELKERMSAPDPLSLMRDRLARIHVLFNRIESLPSVVLCEIGGDALGGGLELALACDLRIAANNTRLGAPEVRLGLFPAAGGTQRLTRLCGPGVASRLVLTGDLIDGEAAHRIGLVEWCVPADDLPQRARIEADHLASQPAVLLRAVKACIAEQSLAKTAGYALEQELGSRLLESPLTKQLVHAFLERNVKRARA
jgi:enoyl-CoA hydratase